MCTCPCCIGVGGLRETNEGKDAIRLEAADRAPVFLSSSSFFSRPPSTKTFFFSPKKAKTLTLSPSPSLPPPPLFRPQFRRRHASRQEPARGQAQDRGPPPERARAQQAPLSPGARRRKGPRSRGSQGRCCHCCWRACRPRPRRCLVGAAPPGRRCRPRPSRHRPGHRRCLGAAPPGRGAQGDQGRRRLRRRRRRRRRRRPRPRCSLEQGLQGHCFIELCRKGEFCGIAFFPPKKISKNGNKTHKKNSQQKLKKKKKKKNSRPPLPTPSSCPGCCRSSTTSTATACPITSIRRCCP